MPARAKACGWEAGGARLRTTMFSAFEHAIAAWRHAGGTGRIWIAVESLYSMDGDQAPLDELAALAGPA